VQPGKAGYTLRSHGSNTAGVWRVQSSIRRVGIPRALSHHTRGALWDAYFSALGIQTVLSPKTSRAIIDEGCRLAVDETCLSVKVALGHVAWLSERCDAVLVPRYVSVGRGERECSKFWGICDIVRNSVPGVELLTYSVDAMHRTHARTTERGELYRLARRLGASRPKAAYAVARALSAHRRERAERVGTNPARTATGEHPRVLVVGHAYNLYDDAIGQPIVRELERQGCDVVDSESVDHRLAARLAHKASPSLYWTNSRQLLGSVEYWRDHVDGIVFLVTFPCGPDSLVTELAVRRMKDVPVVTLIVDEHSGETGLQTRLESFADILRMRREGRAPGCGAAVA